MTEPCDSCGARPHEREHRQWCRRGAGWARPPAEPRCPECGATQAEHEHNQRVANEIRAEHGLPPLDPPNIHTGHQRRGVIT